MDPEDESGEFFDVRRSTVYAMGGAVENDLMGPAGELRPFFLAPQLRLRFMRCWWSSLSSQMAFRRVSGPCWHDAWAGNGPEPPEARTVPCWVTGRRLTRPGHALSTASSTVWTFATTRLLERFSAPPTAPVRHRAAHTTYDFLRTRDLAYGGASTTGCGPDQPRRVRRAAGAAG